MPKTFLNTRQSIQAKLSALVLGLSLTFAVVSICLQLHINYTNTYSLTVSLLEKRADSSLSTIRYSLKKEDTSLLLHQLQSLADMPFVKNVHLTSIDGEQYWADNITRSRKDGRYKKYPLVTQGESIGQLDIYLNLEEIENSALRDAIPAALVYLVEALLVAMLLLMIIGKTCITRVKSLVENIDKIDLNKVNKFAIPHSLTHHQDELGQVARSVQELYMRIRADSIEKRLKERTLKQHKSLLVEEVTARTQAIEWQNLANKLLADLSLRLLKGHKTNVEHDVRCCMPQMAELLGSDHIFWLSFDHDNILYRASYPESSEQPPIDFSDMFKVKRWLMAAQNVALVDVDNFEEDALAELDFLKDVGIHSLAMFPLTDGRKSFGILAATNNHRSLTWNENKSLLLTRFATMLSELTIRERDHYAMAELQEELIMANERLRVEAETDDLTHLLNRRPFSRQLSAALYDTVDDHSMLSVMMIDIDHFKAYNDIYGHLQGDKVLSRVAQAMSGIAKQWDAPLARFGGEEFSLMLPNSDLEKTQKVAWQLCQAVRDLCVSHQGSTSSGIITISIGGITCEPTADTQPNQLLEAADQCLYKAKHGGRNRAILQPYLPLDKEPQ
ncbi:diguanylate cyclase [Enterovibrio norvegicus FF-162]|uniref:GGDEF domain-containing protein n=1 Tax=Enterovibrio norvegicus TaxID=188144 RepID=UPI0002D4848C|nr:GGDEF domain-containing protein [Enterovibrio norvegicus]OEE75438.1 diguanylate cyclase [Enterovibrio norvegicus FF-162]